MNARLVIYKTRSWRRSQRWAWRLVAGNGRILATSGEGYANRAECAETALAVIGGAYNHITT